MQKAARRIVEVLRLHGHQAYFAGGWVRDFLLGRRAQDIDIATSAQPEAVLQLFRHSTPVGAAFGVVQVRMYDRAYDVATFRTEGAYLDGRHPSSVTFTRARQDALRRDFTINGLFYDPMDERVIDYVHGLADLRRRVLRTIGNAEDRFREDRLRLLRAVRLACGLDFRIAEDTWDAVRRFAPGIRMVSAERIRDELLKMLAGQDRARGLDLLYESGLLRQILPEFDRVAQKRGNDNRLGYTRRVLAGLRRRSAPLGLAALLHEFGKSTAAQVCQRLRLSREQTAQVVELITQQPPIGALDEMRESAVKRILLNPKIDEQLELYRAISLATHGDLSRYRFARRQLRDLRHSPPRMEHLISGDDLLQLGYTPGPLFREILRSVDDLALENALRTRAEALQYVLSHYRRPHSGKEER